MKRIFRHTEIACCAFKGTDKTKVLDTARFNTDLIGNVEGAMSSLWKNLRARHEIIHKSAQRRDILEIPEDALREALVNAVTHRNYISHGVFIQLEIYDNRVKIASFGGLHRNLKKTEFGKRSVTGNPLIASLMLRANYIEQMGTGIKKMKDLVKKEKLPPIKFEFTNFTTVTFYRPPYPGGDFPKPSKKDISFNKKLSRMLGVKEEKVNELLQILHHIEKDTFFRLSFSKKYNMSLRTLDRNIILLKDNNFISFEGSRKTGKYKITKKYRTVKK